MAPPKIIFEGDRHRAMMVTGEALSMLSMFKNRISLGKLTQGWQQPRTLQSGETVACYTGFGADSVVIFAPGGKLEKRFKGRKCLCDCNFAVGIIVEITNQQAYDDGDDEYLKYTVLACNDEERYDIYYDVIGNDFTPWPVGMPVLLMAYNDFLFDCCRQNFNATGCAPVVDAANTPHTANWRTTYRIVQVCGLQLPEWTDTYEMVEVGR